MELKAETFQRHGTALNVMRPSQRLMAYLKMQVPRETYSDLLVVTGEGEIMTGCDARHQLLRK